MMADGLAMTAERYNRLRRAEKRLEAWHKRALEEGDGKRALAAATLWVRVACVLDTAQVEGVDPVGTVH
jgi:hypothetical protein